MMQYGIEIIKVIMQSFSFISTIKAVWLLFKILEQLFYLIKPNRLDLICNWCIKQPCKMFNVPKQLLPLYLLFIFVTLPNILF